MAKAMFATLAAAAQDVGGSLSMLSGFVEGIHGPNLPIRQPLSFVARLVLDDSETDRPFPFTVSVENEVGEQIIEVGGQLVARKSPGYDPRLPFAVNLVLPLALECRSTGLYQTRLRTGDVLLASAPLLVRLQRQAP